MFVPFISTPRKTLFRRKGGGGGGKSGGSSGGSKSGGSSSGSGSKSGSESPSTGTTKSVPLSGSKPAGKSSATAYGSGGGATSIIPSGSLFAGRSQGGASRQQVFGTRQYGSGYPGLTGRGVAGRGFPFYFYPLAWGGVGFGGAAYLHDNEYGDPSNSSRPGGAEMQAAFSSNSTNSTFHVLADNSTVVSLISSITANCSLYINTSNASTTPVPYVANATGAPQPEQAVQYFRASSVALTLDGYNDTAALSNDSSLPDTPLPSTVDNNLLDCLNQTIGLAAPLIDSAALSSSANTHSMGIVVTIWVFWWCFGSLLV